MIAGKQVLALIPARGGSKGVPRKNLREAAGRPLIAWSIAAARAATLVDRVVVSSEDAEILATARAWGAETPFTRPAELARDDTPSIDVALHALDALPGFDYLVLLQPTSPLRTAEHIDASIRLCEQRGAPSAVSVCEAAQSPYWMYFVDAAGAMRGVLSPPAGAERRQDLPPVYALNGAVYVARAAALRSARRFVFDDSAAYVMPAEASFDIDTELDLTIVQTLMERMPRASDAATARR
jgi:N-acylneuraminate cytidylyltransferase